jgi:aspartate kinase
MVKLKSPDKSQKMSRIVVKFGGTSVAGIPEIERAADKVAAEVARGHQVAVVVSAMAGVTNQMVEYCAMVSPMHDAREYDAVVSSGENVTAGLMALALQKRGIQARSWQGWQVPIETDEVHGRARIQNIPVDEFKKRFADNEVAVVAGFQGVTERGRISTLGRGGSDTTAVALAAALNADRCDIYTDVSGIFTTDPRIVPQARKLTKISYEEMLEMASLGAKVLMSRSVEMAMKTKVPVQVLSTFEDSIGSDMPGTLVTQESDIMEQHVVNGITYSRDEAKITLLNIPDIPGVAAKVFGPLSEAHINVDMIVQNISADGSNTDMTFTVRRADLPRTLEVLEDIAEFDNTEIRSSDTVAKISVVGIGMQSHSGVAQTMFSALADKGINIQVISTSEIKISVLVDEAYTELAIRALHTAYNLEANSNS